MTKETLTVDEAAAVLGISRISVYKACRLGELKSLRIGKRILVPKAVLESMLNGNVLLRKEEK